MSPRRGQRASLYVRLSRTADEANLSLDGMTADLRSLCDREGLTEVALHIDNGKSGGYRDRPEFLAWIADAREGRADVLVAWHVDRMTREGLNVAAILLDVVEGKDPATGRAGHDPVRLLDTRGLDSNGGESFRWRFVIAAEAARSERERMKDRAKARVSRARSEGRWSGGSTPYGYRAVRRADGPGFTLEPDPAEAEVIRRAAAEVLAGSSLLSILRRLNGQTVEPRTPPRHARKEWTRAGLVSVLTGEAVRGHMTTAVLWEEETVDRTEKTPEGRTIRRRVGRSVLRGEDGLAVKVWEPILSDAVSEELRRALAPKSTRERPGRYAERLLTGLVVCERCSGRMRVRHVRRTRRKGEPEATRPPVAVYECVAYQSGRKCGTGTAGGPTVRADWLEDFVGEDLLRRFGRFGVFEKRVRPGADAERLARVQEAIAATAAALATKADAETFSRLGMLQAERDELAAAPAAPIVEYVPLDPPRAVVDYWPTAGLAERREMLAAYLEVVEVAPTGRRGGPWRFRLDPQRVEVRWSEDALDGESAGPGAIAS